MLEVCATFLTQEDPAQVLLQCHISSTLHTAYSRLRAADARALACSEQVRKLEHAACWQRQAASAVFGQIPMPSSAARQCVQDMVTTWRCFACQLQWKDVGSQPDKHLTCSMGGWQSWVHPLLSTATASWNPSLGP